MRGFLNGLFDFVWPYFAAGIIAGTLITVVYALGGYIKLPQQASFIQWFQFWAIFCGVLSK